MLVPIPAARVLPSEDAAQFCVAPDARAFLDAWQAARATRRSARIAVVDPFARKVQLVDVELKEERLESPAPGFFQWRINFHPSDAVLAQLIFDSAPAPAASASAAAAEPPAAFGTKPLAEDLETGEYVGCVRQMFDGAVPKEPGFRIHGYVFVGRGLIVRGRELLGRATRTGVRGHLLDVWEDIQADADLATLEFLSVAEARRARAEFAEGCRALAQQLELQAPSLVSYTPMAPSDRHATCWACASRNAARHKCSGCSRAYYCSAECQRAHWPLHRAFCRNEGA